MARRECKNARYFINTSHFILLDRLLVKDEDEASTNTHLPKHQAIYIINTIAITLTLKCRRKLHSIQNKSIALRF